MARIVVNPDVQAASGDFPLWADGKYHLRIDEIQEETSAKGQPMLRVSLVPTDSVTDEEGNTLPNPGRLFDRVMVEPVTTKKGQAISFLRVIVEAAGLSWQDFDTDELQGREVVARVGRSTYTTKDGQSRTRNEIVGYVKP